MQLKSPAPAETPTGEDGANLGSSVGQGPSPPAPSAGIGSASHRMTYHNALTNTLANLDKYDLRDEDLKDLNELGQGNGGSVKRVEHVPTHTIMAKKIVLIDAKPSVRKQILRELQIMHNCHSDYIVSFYGAFLSDPNICICMEFADKGSLDGIYKRIGAIDIEVVALVALAVLEGLTYLYDVHRIIHRGMRLVLYLTASGTHLPPLDIKPSNILCNSKGQIKICDFGVSGELINSIADTFVGTSTYMSPERIQGAQYTVKSDVWSLGISLIELALGRFPFADSSSDDDSDLSEFEGTLSPSRPMELPPSKSKKERDEKKAKKNKRKSKGHIVNEPAPRLTPEGRFSRMAEEFVDGCLLKDPDVRKTPKELLQHEWILHAKSSNFDLEAWASTF
ncbi:kinase [Vararia minispora EC-137]|uniref:Kinase n=1 Tax=Vararia minispora EC-137 TaxID=1314806 RepID=A0ACB8QMJ7_9AGAM|nr:kinase [Vararia minispora EC-137]